MHSARFGLLVSILLLNFPVWARQAPQQASAPQPASDPQAVAVVQTAITALGGAAAIGQAQSWTFQAQMQGPIASGDMTETITFAIPPTTGTTVEAPRNPPSRVQVPSLFLPVILGPILLKDSQDQTLFMRSEGTMTLGPTTATVVTFTTVGRINFVEQKWYFDSGTGLPAMVEFRLPPVVGPTDGFAGIVTLSDFRPVAGIVYPFHLEIRLDGWVRMQEVNVQSVK
jgi:hypothetical protein